jgi:hypothetical protein
MSGDRQALLRVEKGMERREVVSEPVPPRSAAAMLRRFLILVLLLGLAGAVAFLLSERNARAFAVEQREGELHVTRGRFLPYGFQLFRPADKALAAAYAPIPFSAGDSPGELMSGPFEDRDALDRALFTAMRGWVEARLDVDDPERLAQALRLLRRLELLTGIADSQRKQLHDLQAKVSFFEGRARLDDGLSTLREAVARLKAASESHGKYARDAGELYERIIGLTEQLSRAAREPLSASRSPGEPAAPGAAPQGAAPSSEAPKDGR